LVVNADTTPANMHEAPCTAPIHDALAAKGLAPSEHLVDYAYISAAHLIAARERHGIDLAGSGRRNLSWQSRSGGDAFIPADFSVDWDRQVVRCPEGVESASWTAAPTAGTKASSSTSSFAPPTVGSARHGPAAPGRARSMQASDYPQFRVCRSVSDGGQEVTIQLPRVCVAGGGHVGDFAVDGWQRLGRDCGS
jgi:hypothetical protein